MSRVGKQPIQVPQGVEVTIGADLVSVKGPKGHDQVSYNPLIKVERKENEILVTRPNDEPKSRALHGLTRMLVSNLIEGVTKGYRKEMEVVGTGYTVLSKQNGLLINVGYSHPIFVGPMEDITYEVINNTNFAVAGVNKYLVGEISAKIRSIRPPEPYKGKGIRYKGEHIRRKAGKTVGK